MASTAQNAQENGSLQYTTVQYDLNVGSVLEFCAISSASLPMSQSEDKEEGGLGWVFLLC